MAKFRVTDSFPIENQHLFVLAGSIVEGVIRRGMLANIQLNSALHLSLPIHSIEFARRSGGREDVCLCFRYSDPDELVLWQGLKIGDEVIDVVENDNLK